MKQQKSRRAFLELALAAGASLPFLGATFFSCNEPSLDAANQAKAKGGHRKLNILILGGTSFLGPHQIAYAISRGHTITTFTRGKTQPSIHQELFKQVESLVGDRENDLTALHNRKWDAVIDNSGRNVEWTKASANLLKESAEIYLYTSSTGVYYPYTGQDFREDGAVHLSVPEGMPEDDMALQYGITKANSELEAQKAFGKERTIVVRPTYMIGPADKTNRFIHWPIRLSRGGETMVPGKAKDAVQYMDVRDVAEWMIRLIEEKKAGVYNAVGPKQAQNIHSFIGEAQKAFDVESTFVKIDDYKFLEENKVFYIVPWVMPEGENQGSAQISNEKAIKNGLTFRPPAVSTKDTHDWWYSDAVTQEERDKVEKDAEGILLREQSIIAAWKSR